MARVVITMEGGLIQHIMADTEDVQVMVMDYDTEGVEAWRLKEYDDSPVYTWEGVDDINPDLVDEIDRTLFKEMPAVAGGDVGYLPFNLAPVGQEKPQPGKSISRHLLSFSQAGTAGFYPLPAVPASVTKGFDEEAYWRRYMATHTPLENLFQRKIKRFFYEQRKRQLRLMEERLGRTVTRELSVEGLLLNPEEENGLLKQVVWPLYLEIGGEAGKMILVELGADPGLFNLPDTPAMAALESKLIKVVGINETVREQLRKTLLDGISQMEATAQLMDRVRQVYNFAQTRALTIARTETGQAAGIARDAAMNMLEVKKHRWVTAGDEHVRLSHQALNGVVVERGQLFPNGCHFPCDPYGPAKEIISCRCVVPPWWRKELEHGINT